MSLSNFKEANIDISYKNIGEDSYCSILNPLLSCTKLYRRSVGFFSSSALYFIKDGVIELARNGGHIQLATSPKLSSEDIEAIKMGYDARSIYEKRTLEEFRKSIEEMDKECIKNLYLLIKEKILDIQIVKKKNGGLYHDKLAVLTDHDDNVIACVGSNNESSGGYNDNYEKIRIYRSWVEPDRVNDEIEEFQSIWSKTNTFLDVYDFSSAFRENILDCVNREANKKTGNVQKKEENFLRPYQQKAKDAWINNGYKGFYEMATGTGKTFTSLFSFIELIRNQKVFTVILAPYKHLVNQWFETINRTFSDVDVVMVHGELKNADSIIYAKYVQSLKSYKPIIIVSTISSFFLQRYQELYERITFEKLLVVDEAHNFINKISQELSDKYKYKLGLSATPVFGNDITKTEFLLDWFGGKVATYTLEEAIGTYLTKYEYIPIFVNSTEEDEDKFKKATMAMVSATDPKTGAIIDKDKFNVNYRARLRAISMAEEKINKISWIFNQVKEKDHTIIYCSDGKLCGSNSDKGDSKHLDYILKLINNSLLDIGSNLKASKFTATEDAQTRMDLIKLFNSNKLNYLVAIRCLDEGIDIPSIKSALILSSNDNYREFVQRRGRILRLYKGKNIAKIYDVIVLPSHNNKPFIEIEMRRFNEYSRLAINKDELMEIKMEICSEYGLTEEDIQFKNEYIYGGDLDE